MLPKIIHGSYYVAGDENDLYSEVALFYHQWTEEGCCRGDGAVHTHARYLHRIGVPNADRHARDARAVKIAMFRTDNLRCPDLPVWANSNYLCIGLDAVALELIQDVRIVPYLSNTFKVVIVVSPVAKGGCNLEQEVPNNQIDRLKASLARAKGAVYAVP